MTTSGIFVRTGATEKTETWKCTLVSADINQYYLRLHFPDQRVRQLTSMAIYHNSGAAKGAVVSIIDGGATNQHQVFQDDINNDYATPLDYVSPLYLQAPSYLFMTLTPAAAAKTVQMSVTTYLPEGDYRE